MKTIHFIYADGCDSCKAMRVLIDGCKKTSDFELVAMECELDAAVTFAVDNGIADIPACKIGDKIIEGEHFNGDELVRAINRYCK